MPPDKDPLLPMTVAIQHKPGIPGPLPPFNERTYADRHGPGFKNRFRALLWRIVTPLLGLQRPFNATVVDQLNRVLASHREAQTYFAQYEARVYQHLMGTESLAEDWLKHWDALEAREARTQQRIDHYTKSIDDLRATAALAHQAALSLKRDVEALLGRDSIRGKVEDYVPRFEGLSNVIELGSGRGEFLELLKARGVAARGIEGDALTFFQALDDASVGGVFSTQFVQHLPPAYLVRLLETVARKVRPGGLVILETTNAHPETLQHVVRASGFREVTIEHRAPVAAEDRLRPLPSPPPGSDAAAETFVLTYNENVAKLNRRLFGPLDYAVVARR
jgi:O-antigen chain-terminating methyltransferase